MLISVGDGRENWSGVGVSLYHRSAIGTKIANAKNQSGETEVKAKEVRSGQLRLV